MLMDLKPLAVAIRLSFGDELRRDYNGFESRHDYGTHGPTCCMRPYKRTDNPEMLPHLIEAWNRGYYQDARRLTPRSILTAVYGEQA